MLRAKFQVMTGSFLWTDFKPEQSVTLHINESSSDREYADIDFFRLDPSIRKIVFVLTINEALERNLNFSMVQDAYIRILNPDSGQKSTVLC